MEAIKTYIFCTGLYKEGEASLALDSCSSGSIHPELNRFEKITGWLRKRNQVIMVRLFLFLSVASFVCCNTKTELPKGDPGNGGLALLQNFEAVVVVDSIGPARHIAVNDNGDIYVKLRYSKKGEAGNIAIRDINNDGKADSIVRFGDYKDEGSMATGMRIHNGYLYFSSDLVIYLNKLTQGKLIPESKIEVVLTDDHKHGTHWHITKPMSFENKGHMFVPFGAPSNACQDLV